MPCAPTGLTIRHQSARGHNRFFVMRGMRIRHGNRQAATGRAEAEATREKRQDGRAQRASRRVMQKAEGEETTAAAPERAQPFVMLTRPSYGL